MDAKELKRYIYDHRYIEQILESIGCHSIKYHISGDYYTAANPDGDNKNAIVVYNNESLNSINFTRNIDSNGRTLDIIDIVSYAMGFSFIKSLQMIANEVGLSYYHNFDEDEPESFKILKLLDNMSSNDSLEDDRPLKPISENILSYYKSYVNDLFLEDGIDYVTQQDFEIGYDEQTNRFTIPIRSELGDLIGVKGRYFYKDVPEGVNKYVYLEPCSKSKVLYGLDKTIQYIKNAGKVYVGEAEKFTMQCWSMGYRNSVSTGGKVVSSRQVDMLIRLGVDIIFCFDKDVDLDELNIIANKFPENIPLYYMIDETNLLQPHESPTDHADIWNVMVKNNIYRLR